MKLTLLLIPLILLSSCTMSMDEKNTTPQPVTDNQSKTPDTPAKPTEHTLSGMTKDFGSGFTLTQTEDETKLSYSGKTIKTWSNIPPKKVPFVGDEACVDFFEAIDGVSSEDRENNKNWKQSLWEKFDGNTKKSCIKEDFLKNISTDELTERFYEIIKSGYAGWDSWIYDVKTGIIQKMPTIGKIQIFETSSGILIHFDALYGDTNTNILYDSDFSKIISTEEIPK